jgi:putative transposase
MVRHSLKYVGWKERKEVATDLKEIYASSTMELAESALEGLERKWNSSYPLIAKSWRANWQRIIPFLN